MTLTTPYSATFIVGDGETKTFSYLFEEVSPNFISVMVYNSLTGLISTPTYVIDTDQKQVIFGEDTPAPTADETVCIYRNTPNVQDVAFRTLHGYDAQTLENILSKIVAMIQEIKSNYFSTQVLQGDPWQLDLLSSADDGATVNIDYTAKKLVKGLYFRITSGNLQVSADGTNYITMPKSADVVEFRQHETVKEDLTVEYRLQYRVGNIWYNAESNAEATADEALQIAQDAKDIAQAASDKVDAFDDRLTIAEGDASDAKQDASDAKDIAQTASDAVSGHITDTNNPHSVTAAQTGALPNTTKYGANLSLTLDSTTYVVTAQLKDQDGNNLGTAQTIDLPLESVVVSGAYDNVTKEVVLTLQGGSTIRFSVADLVSGLQTEITALNMLSADLVDDTNTTHKFVTTTEKTTWNGKQDAISDLATIRSGASAGATAVQPSDLATVATSGSYNDLINKPTIPTVDQTYDATSANAQSGVAINGANFLVNNAADSANGVAIKGSGRVQSTQIGALGSAVSMATSVGFSCFASGAQSVAVGHGSQATASKSYAFGEQAKSTAIGAFQFGQATNNEAGSVYFGLTLDGNTTNNYKLLGSDGLIPDARISSNIARTSDLATVATTGAYSDLTGKPTIPTVNDPTITITQGGVTKGSFSLNQATGDTIALDAGGGGGGSSYHPDLFDWKWADHQLNDVQWLRGDTFSWQNGAVYETAYQHLVDDIDGKTLQSETIGSTTIQFYLADDGHKICPASEESNVAAIYTATGVAWYYILDTANNRFKLPRSKHNKYAASTPVVGNGLGLGLTNGTKTGVMTQGTQSVLGAGVNRAGEAIGTSGSQGTIGSAGVALGVVSDPDNSGLIATLAEDTDQHKYLYFYVGEFTQTAIENTAGLNAELFNDKVDIGHQVIDFQAPTAQNNYTWYRKYADGWVEQGGTCVSSSTQNQFAVTYPVEMADANYNLQVTIVTDTNSNAPTYYAVGARTKSATGFTCYMSNNITKDWRICGMAA